MRNKSEGIGPGRDELELSSPPKALISQSVNPHSKGRLGKKKNYLGLQKERKKVCLPVFTWVLSEGGKFPKIVYLLFYSHLGLCFIFVFTASLRKLQT